MKGNNVFLFNEATMMEALQHWLNGQFVGDSAPIVTAIQQQPSQDRNSPRQFEISVKSEEAS